MTKYFPFLFQVECYDELGTRYAIPVYCLSYPLNIVVESDRDSPAEFSEPISSNHPEGHDHKVRVRISLTGDDVVLIVNTADSVMAAKRKLQSQETPKVPEPSRQRWYYSGKLLGDKMKISDINAEKISSVNRVKYFIKLLALPIARKHVRSAVQIPTQP